MFDRWEYKIPANTAEKDRIRIKCGISPGTLRALIIYFPPGCQGYARCRIAIGERPVAPRSPAGWLAAEGLAIPITQINEPIKYDMPVLNWDVWNEDDTYPHTIWMSAEWTSEDEPYDKKTAGLIEVLVKEIKGIIGI